MKIHLPLGHNKIRLNTTNATIAAVLLCSAMSGIVPQLVLNCVIIALCFVLFLEKELYLVYPFMLFYYRIYGMFFGISVYRCFSFLLLFSAIIVKPRLPKRHFAPIVVYLLYLIVVQSGYSIQNAVFCFVDILCCVIVVVGYLSKDPSCLKKFFYVYVAAALVAVFTGLIGGNILEVQGDIELFRFCATFEDPNYMGYFYTVAVFALVSLSLFSPGVRWAIIGIMYAVILSTVSITAIIVNIIMWLVFLAVSKKITLKTFGYCAAILLGAVALYQYGLSNPDTMLLGDLSSRINQKIQEATRGDISAATTERSVLTSAHFLYFVGLPVWKKLFGGTAVNTYYISNQIYAAAHNEYVDMLLNVGIIGTVILLSVMISSFVSRLKKYHQTQDNTHLCILMCKGIWFLYAGTLTLFLDYRFLFPVFM